MKKIITLLFLMGLMTDSFSQLVDYKVAENNPNANYFTVAQQWRTKLQAEEAAFRSLHPGQKLPEELREEIAQFERWAYNWKDKVDINGKFPSSAEGFMNLLKDNPKALNANAQFSRTQAAVWTSIGPLDSSFLNGWSYGAGIGRVNVIRKIPNQNTLVAGAAAGGIFRSTNMGDTWIPVADNLAGLGISDIVIDPNNSNIMYAVTGDWDASHIASVGVFKSTDAGMSWNITGLTFTLSQNYKIAHLAIDPANSNIIYATGRDNIHRSTDAGVTWTDYYSPGSNFNFNDIIKIGTNWFVSDKSGVIYKTNPAMTGPGDSFIEIYNNGSNNRLDFAWTPANPDTLYLLKQTNPAFAKFSIVTNTATTYKTVNNVNPADGNANFNTQGGYNQVIAVSPTNKDSIWVGEFSGGKLSIDGGNTWQNKFNGYYDPTNANTSWGGYYLHSDQHDFRFAGSDTMLVANDGGVYVGKISTNNFKQKFNGLVITQSYSMAINDAEPRNLMLGNQDNDGSSRFYDGVQSKFYAAQAGDGTSTAISRTDNLTRYVGGTNGSLSYRTDGFTTGFSGDAITTPTGSAFVWDLQMHNTDGTILYGGFGDLNKMTGAPTGAWTSLNAGAGQIGNIYLANNNATTQKIIVIGTNGTIRKSADETNWSTITPPVGVAFNSVYPRKTNWDTIFATASAYNAANKIFMSINNGGTWINITKNFPNVLAKKIVMYEGTDTIFVGTEVGMYFARITDAVAGVSPWNRYGTGLPNVRIEDIEISYAKKQIFAGTFGRGVWMASIAPDAVLPLNGLDFSYLKNTAGYSLKWKIENDQVRMTTLGEKL